MSILRMFLGRVRMFTGEDRGDIVQYLLIIALLVVFFLPDITNLQTSIQGVFGSIGTELSKL